MEKQTSIADVLSPEKYIELLNKGKIKEDQVVVRQSWEVDKNIPEFNKDKSFIEGLLK